MTLKILYFETIYLKINVKQANEFTKFDLKIINQLNNFNF